MDDTNYIAHLGGRLREIVVECYISGLKNTYGKCFSYPKKVKILTYRQCFRSCALF